MPKGENSSIVNVSSVGGIKEGPGTGNDAGYNASKAAVRNLSKHASYVFASSRIRVNSLHPAGINTEMMQAVLASHPEIKKGLSVKNPLPPHYSETEDVANSILFLASDDARTITGAELVVDNGTLAI
jgi:NAD(P)-dependent dehydrogenase (short-subunit alcohol dehydrogenase family)